MEGKGNGTGEEASSKIAQAEERVENVPPPFAAEIEEHDRADRDYFDRLPPGYRFEPTDGNLIAVYLKNRILNLPLPRNRIRDVNVYDYHPHQLTSVYKSHRGTAWYFFTPTTKKSPNGQRPERAAGDGYWKANGAEFPVCDKQGIQIGTRRSFVYYEGKPKDKSKMETDWIMQEYSLIGSCTNELDKCVLCMIYNKSSKEGPDANDNQQDDNNMMIVPANNGEYPHQNPNGACPVIPVQNWQVQSPNTNQGWDGANLYDTSHLLMQNVNVQNDSITQGGDGGRFGNMASLRMQNVQVPTHGLDSGPFYNMESGHNVQVPNSNVWRPWQNVQVPNSNVWRPWQNLQVPNSSIAQALQNGRFHDMASFPYGGVFDNTASSHIQNNDGSVVANHFYDMAIPRSDFDQNIYATNGSYFRSWGNGHHVYNNQQGPSADPLEMMQAQNQNPMSQPIDYQSMGNGSEVTPHLDYATSDHNLFHEDLHNEEINEFLESWAVSSNKDEEPLDCKDGQLGGPHQASSSKSECKEIDATNEEQPPNENQTGVVSDNLVNLNEQVQDPNTSQSPECKDEEVGGSDEA